MPTANPNGSKTKSERAKSSARRGTRSGVLRRPPEKGLPRFKHEMRGRWRRLLERWQVWASVFVLTTVWCLLPQHLVRVPALEPGNLAPRTFLADRDLSVVNEAATRDVQRAAMDGVRPIYDFDRVVEARRAQQLGELFAAGREALVLALEAEAAAAGGNEVPTEEPSAEPQEDPLLATLRAASGLKLPPEAVEELHRRGFPIELEDRLSGVLRRALRQGVIAGKDLLLEHRDIGITVQELPSGRRSTRLDLYRYLDYPDQVREAVDEDLANWQGFDAEERGALAELLVVNITPNLTFNNSETLELRQLAAEETGAVSHSVREGEVIVRKGEIVDELASRTLGELASAHDADQMVLALAGVLLLAGAGMFVVWLVCGREPRHDRSRQRFFGEAAILLSLQVMGVHLAYFVAQAVSNAIPREPFASLQSYTFAIPFAALALIGVLLYGRNPALVMSLVGSLLVGHVTTGEGIWKLMLFSLASSLAAVYVLDQAHFRQRSVMTRAGATVGAVNVFMVLTIKALASDTAGGWSQLGFDLVCAFVGGLLAAAVASFAVPILEPLLELTTYIKLLELANPNLPLLRRLRAEAPGTFQHSLAVANLAEAGCEAIGRDPLVVHTAALYHDIGKVLRPQYFVENQVPGQNPHDKIQPSMSALILINHVKEGLELAHQNHLPKIVNDAIAQHHGTRLIKFFFARAKERCDPETEEVREDEFRYPGPKPQSKEMGILMLADAVEAASRTLVEPSRQKLRGLLRTLFDDCLHDHQLDHTDLTLGDLSQVEEAFLRVLTNIYHRRIDYPGYNFNAPGGRKGQDAKNGADTKKRPGPAPEDGSGIFPAQSAIQESPTERPLPQRRAS